MNEILLISLVIAPIFLGIFLYFQKSRVLLSTISVLFGVVFFLLSLYVFCAGEGIVALLPLITPEGLALETQRFGSLYAVLLCFLWLVSLLSSVSYFQDNSKNLSRYYASVFFTLSGCLGLFFAADLLTLFIFFEIMSFSSYLWVLQEETSESITGSNLYLSYGVVGGMLLLLGIFSLSAYVPSLRLDELYGYFSQEDHSGVGRFSGICMFLGFGAKAGVFFLHSWLPQTYLAAPAPATALLSGVLSKGGIYGILLVLLRVLPLDFDFASFLLFLSLLNMFFGALFAYLSGNIKRIFAFSSISQIGFILFGASFTVLLESHNSYAAMGTLFHMVNHSLIKVLFFLLVGMIFLATGTHKLEELRGFGRGKYVFQGIFTLGALALGGVPLFSGYVSKTLLHESIVEYLHYYEAPVIFHAYEWIFVISGGFTVAYLLKVYTCLFFSQGEKDWSKGCVFSKKSMLAVATVALVLLVLGLTPNLSFHWIGDYTADFFHAKRVDSVDYFAWANLKGALYSLLLGCLLHYLERTVANVENTPQYREQIPQQDFLYHRVLLPGIEVLTLISAVVMRLADVALETLALRGSQRNFHSLAIPETFYYGEEHLEKKESVKIHITHSLAYSLLMFGLGFIFTIVYLLVVGGTLS